MTAPILVILPLEGSPYILDEPYMLDGENSVDGSLELLHSIVQGKWVESVSPREMAINSYGDKQWALANALLAVATQVWANENGMYDCSPNMLCIQRSRRIPFFGRMAIEIPADKITDAHRAILKTKKLGL
jgi:hypothetical protein